MDYLYLYLPCLHRIYCTDPPCLSLSLSLSLSQLRPLSLAWPETPSVLTFKRRRLIVNCLMPSTGLVRTFSFFCVSVCVMNL